MNNEHATYDLFFRYENGTLQAEELRSFQERLNNDSVFREAFEDYQLAGEIVLTERLYQVRKQLNQLDYHKFDQSGSSNIWKYIIGISGAIFIGGLGYYLLHEDSTHTATQPAKEIITPLQENKSQNHISSAEPTGVLPNKTTTPVPGPATKRTSKNITEGSGEPATTTVLPVFPFPTQPEIDQQGNSQPNTAQAPAGQTDPCKGISIQAKEILSDATCSRGSNGKITVKGINGGHAPYHCIVNKRSYAEGNFNFEYLRAGDYEIKIIDQQQCESTSYFVEVGEKNCENDISIKPGAGIYWTPTLTYADASVHIQDKAGNLILNRKISGQDFTWDGTDQYGNLLSNGLYFYKIIYTNGEKESGTITIIE